MTGYFLLAGGIFAVLDWLAVYRANRKIEAFAKPLTMIFLLVWGMLVGIENKLIGTTSLPYFLIGLFLCLLGDIFLFLPPEKFFMPGLVAFLLGHIGYIIGFGWVENLSGNLVPILIFAGVIIFVGWQVTRRITAALKTTGQDRLLIPVVIYATVISVMLFLAGLRFFDRDWTTAGAFLVSSGAFIFYVSDVLNAWERFVKNFPHDRLIIMMLYHLGQYGIAVGAVLHFSRALPG